MRISQVLALHGVWGGGTDTPVELPIIPSLVTTFTATANNDVGTVTLLWTNPDDQYFSYVMVVRGDETYPANPTDGTLVYTGSLQTATDKHPKEGANYYSIFSVSKKAVVNPTGKTTMATVIKPVEPGVPCLLTTQARFMQDGEHDYNVGFYDDDGDYMWLIWYVPDDPNFAGVRIVRNEDHIPTSPSDGLTVFEGEDDISSSYPCPVEGYKTKARRYTGDTDLTRGKKYYYRVFAYDINGVFNTELTNESVTVEMYQSDMFKQSRILKEEDTPHNWEYNQFGKPGGNSYIWLVWGVPDHSGYVNTRVVYNFDHIPMDIDDGTVIDPSTYHECGSYMTDFSLDGYTTNPHGANIPVDTSLYGNKTCYVRIFALDSDGYYIYDTNNATMEIPICAVGAPARFLTRKDYNNDELNTYLTDDNGPHFWIALQVPEDGDFSHAHVYYRNDRFPESPDDGTLLVGEYDDYTGWIEVAKPGYKSACCGADVYDITPGETYYMRIFTYDYDGYYRTGGNESTLVLSAYATLPAIFTNVGDVSGAGQYYTDGDAPHIWLCLQVPDDVDHNDSEVVYRTDRMPTSLDDGTMIDPNAWAQHSDWLVVEKEGYLSLPYETTLVTTPGETYYLRAFTTDKFGATYTGGDESSLVIQAVGTPQICMFNDLDVYDNYSSGLIADKNGTRFWLAWATPNDPDYAGVRIVRNTDHTPNDINDGVVVYEGMGSDDSSWANDIELDGYQTGLRTYSDYDIELGKTYYYRLFAFDTLGAYNTDPTHATYTRAVNKVTTPSVSNLRAVGGDGCITLTWDVGEHYGYVQIGYVKDGVMYDGISDESTYQWTGYKTGTSYTVYGLENGHEYGFYVWAFSVSGVEASGRAVQGFAGTAPVYGFAVDETNSDPYSAVTYIEDSTGFTPATNPSAGNFNGGSWLDKYPFNRVNPCRLNNDGTVELYVNPNDFSVATDGTDVSGANRLMIEIPPVYWKFTKTTNGYEVRWSSRKVDDGYQALAHSRGGVLKGNLYVGAYEGNYSSTYNALCSRHPKTPTVSESLATFRTYANNWGSGYELMNFHTRTLLQILFVGMFKTLDSQSALGRGIVDATAIANTGTLDTLGMYYGSINDQTTGVKFMGVENLWGNIGEWVDGILTTSNGVAISDGTVYNDTGANYPTILPSTSVNSEYGHCTKVVGTQEGGFLSASSGGSGTTYYCDATAQLNGSGEILRFGGSYTNTTEAGLFCMYISDVGTANEKTSARLQYLAP